MKPFKTFLWEFWLFGLKQASASLFGGFLLLIILVTEYWYPIGEYLYRYDFLLLCAIGFQISLLLFRLEKLREAVVILVFHVVATGMELFKTSDAIQSWSYPGDFRIGIGNVPLFAGFMYSAVGSYLARVARLFEFRYNYYPPQKWAILFVIAIYVNFFTHHFFYDARTPLLIGSVVLFGTSWVHFRMDREHRRMPLLIGCLLVALFIWFAENIATYCRIWVYPSQHGSWKMVPFSKLVAWYLLMLLSFVLVNIVNKPELIPAGSESYPGSEK